MTRAPLLEAKDSMAKASTPEPFSPSRTSNWVARGGGLPDYIQHIAHDLMEKRGKSESNAIQMAIGIVKRWARGGGNVDAGTRAAAAKAVAEWEKLKAGNAAKRAVKESAAVPSVADEMALREAALARLAVYSATFGTAGLVDVLAEGVLAESAAWTPTLKRTASARDEIDRHEVYDGSQHVGTISRRRGYGPSEGERHAAFALNGERVTDYGERSRQGAIDALRKHLEEAPARVVSWPSSGKFLVAKPSSYSGETSYAAFSSEAAARHAAGLPPAATVPEIGSKVQGLAEALRWDLGIVAGLDIAPLRRVQEARRSDPFELVSEAFHADELRGFHGRWVGHSGRELTPSSLPPRLTGKRAARASRSATRAEHRYEGGTVRASARLRAAHAAKPQIARASDEKPEAALAASIGEGKWSKSAGEVSRRLGAQPPMSAGELAKAVRAGTALDTEKAHRTGRGGAYSAERKALHEQIISNLLQGKGVHEGNARAVFTAGGGASGKSAMIRSGVVKVPHDTVIANPDVIREMLPEYKALKRAGREDAASLVHEEASHLTKVLMRVALARQHHILVDGVGDSGAGKFAGKIRAAQAAGHAVSVHYATVPTAEAIRRSDARGRKTGRFVPHDVLREAHAEVSRRFGEVSKIRGVHLQVFDTGQGTKLEPLPPKLIAEHHGSPDKLVIGGRSEFRDFLRKAEG